MEVTGFTCFCSVSGKLWHRFDDMSVTRKTPLEVLKDNTRDGYIFFYLRHDQDM